MGVPPLSTNIALFLDFDGTLVELAPRPEDVAVPAGTPVVLRNWLDQLEGAVAIVSGRPIDEIDAFLAPCKFPAAGLHGLQHRWEQEGIVERDTPDIGLLKLKELVLSSGLIGEDILLEDKDAAFAVHYRAAPVREPDVRALMGQLVKKFPALHLVEGKMVVEAKPKARDKGKAVQDFMKILPFRGKTPIFVGDDVTDEDGMAAAEQAGGYGIKVGAGPTCARYRLQDVAAVYEWLAKK
ncbi:trehalose 6-phosphate phosphatase [Roseibium hamelinense]|uniref:Trehalose 6-phosphate phosphatase n=1 Tax=Roseibium hamelinense TaxID=150831 RepID=A0A562T2B0_9HYPH|nr:trehalose-phosphatase [Roseibium hamelinense]MTI42045.1 trehalose-phosphatase [Roseibium hamelinense]TWI87358.1 trehalose 6-phosphate phosphatase [Roseibium hamelinense]